MVKWIKKGGGREVVEEYIFEIFYLIIGCFFYELRIDFLKVF